MAEIAFRPLLRADFPLLARWLAAPHVARWWNTAGEAEDVEAHYGPAIDGADPTDHFVVLIDGRPAGMAQAYHVHDHPDWERVLHGVAPQLPRCAGIDYLLGEPGDIGHGNGSAMVAAFAAFVFDHFPDAEAITADPEQANEPSWRALERAGFERWYAGPLDSDEPGHPPTISYVYVLRRPQSSGAGADGS